MARQLPQHHHSLEDWRRRLDRAAGRMNPFLTLVMIGLILINLVGLALVAPHLPIYRDSTGCVGCVTAQADGDGPGPRPTHGVKGWPGY